MRSIVVMVFLGICANALVADPAPKTTYKHPDSKCIVEGSAGEYPRFKVTKENKIIYEPQSDGIIKIAFSPNGKFIAFSGSEISLVDITPRKYEYSVVVLKCDSGELMGFTDGFPDTDLEWNGNNVISYTDTASGKKVEIKL